LGLPWDGEKALKSAKIMYEKIWNFKFLPPGRGLWVMGTPFIDRMDPWPLNNCGFVSTEDIDIRSYGISMVYGCIIVRGRNWI
jgi:hypothetical protein